jgi:hypothetical protein
MSFPHFVGVRQTRRWEIIISALNVSITNSPVRWCWVGSVCRLDAQSLGALRPARRRGFFISPRIAVLLQAMHGIIGNAVAFFVGQFLAKSAHKSARTL